MAEIRLPRIKSSAFKISSYVGPSVWPCGKLGVHVSNSWGVDVRGVHRPEGIIEYFELIAYKCATSGGSRISRRGGMDLRRRRFLVKMYAKMKEWGPIGGGVRPARPP